VQTAPTQSSFVITTAPLIPATSTATVQTASTDTNGSTQHAFRVHFSGVLTLSDKDYELSKAVLPASNVFAGGGVYQYVLEGVTYPDLEPAEDCTQLADCVCNKHSDAHEWARRDCEMMMMEAIHVDPRFYCLPTPKKAVLEDERIVEIMDKLQKASSAAEDEQWLD
jgi:hypothetical protein